MKLSDVSSDVIEKLNSGHQSTRHFMESLSVDFGVLLQNVMPDIKPASIQSIEARDGIKKRMVQVAHVIHEQYGIEAFDYLSAHASDTVRGWACFLVSYTPEFSLSEKLSMIRPLADDPHFGVREWAWLVVRPYVALNIEESVCLLRPWVDESSDRLRRFAIEVTRPRGVWCSHIPLLKTEPELGLSLLDPLCSDHSKYVQDSVSNWLNDAAKSRSEWVLGVCEKWLQRSPTVQTERICRRARRSINLV